jgi:hypothetical protein
LFSAQIFGQAVNCNQGDQKPNIPDPPVMDSIPADSTDVTVSAPVDPNEIIGTVGYDALGDTMQWVAATASLPYTIYFENDPDFATAAAQRVEVRHKLHAKASRSTFVVGTFGFGSHVFSVEGSPSSYQARLDLIEDMGIYVDVVAGLDVVNNEAFWILQSIDPATGLAPISVDMGFLPVNDSTHCGEGFVSFTIKPNERQCVTGDTITAMASIVFDINEAIPTNKWVNTIDAHAPTTLLTGTEVEPNELLLQFTGSDDTNGCGIKQYKLYMSDNYGSYQLYDAYLPETEATFMAEPGHCYRFFCLGEDNVGNIEAMKEEAEYEYGNYDLLITVAASPEDGGTVSGGGLFAHGTQATVTAQPNSGFSFERWSYNGITVSTNPTYTFTVEGSRDLVANFVYSGSIILTQTDCLNTGWNWWSSYITMNTAEDFNLVKDALGSNASMIKSRTDGFVTYMGSWFGTLYTINNKSMYMINMNSEQTIEITGLLADMAMNPITINPGWNWIGFPSSVSVSLNTALANMSPKETDLIKTRTAFATYYSAMGGWFGTLTSLTPGLGYMYKSNNGETFEFIYSTAARGDQEPLEVQMTNHWDLSIDEYPDNATLIGVIAIDGVEQRREDLVIGAFVGNRCVGQANALYIEPLDRYLVFLAYLGNDNDEVTFRLYDGNNGIEHIGAETSLVFTKDAMIGSMDEPYVINFGVMSVVDIAKEVKLFPNPVKATEKVHVSLNEANVTSMKLEIVNTLGVIVYQNSYNTVATDITVPRVPGIYIVKITASNDNIYYGKLIVE